MNTLTRPRNLLDDFFQDFPFGYQIAPLHGDPLPRPGQLKVDIKENNGKLVIQAEIPGVKKDDIDVSIDNNVLTIGAEISQYDEDRDNDKVLHSERYYGAVKRSISLPSEVATDQAEARYEDGMLTLTLPKASPDKAQKIAVG